MVKAAKAHTKRALALNFSQAELNFKCAKSCKHPIFPYGKVALAQPFYSTLQRTNTAEKTIGNTIEVSEVLLATIKLGLKLLKHIILTPELNLLELKSVTAIVTTYLPERSSDQKVLKSYALWNSFTRNLSRSNRRTTFFRLSVATQMMGNEIPELKNECKSLINKLFLLIKGETGNIKDRADRREWEKCLESKPLKYIKVGTTFYTKL
jgi:hypothetical protein